MARTAGLTLELNNYRAFSDEMRNLDRIIDGLDTRIDRVGRSMDKFERDTDEAGRSLQGLGQKSQQTSRQVASDFQAIGQEAQRLESAGQRLEGFGARLTLFFSGPAAALKALATDAAIEFESSFAGVKKTLDTTGLSAEETAAAFGEIRDGIRELATDSTKAVSGIENAQNELARIAELGGQLGIANDDLLTFTETVGNLTLATELTAEAASTAIAQFANITGGREFDRLGSTIVELGNRLATTEGQVLEFGARLAAAGTQAGFSQADILGLGGAMASLGLEAEAGGTAMTRVFNSLGVAVATSNEDLKTFAAVAGVSVEEFATLFEEDAAGALTTFVEGLSELDRASQLGIFEQLGFSDVRVQDTLSRLASNPALLAEGIELANAAFEDNTALQNEANQRFETTAAQMNLLQNNIRDVAISLGDALLPKINAMIDFFVPLIRNIADVNPEILAFGATLLGIAAASGPVVLYLSQFIQFFEFMASISLAPLFLPLAAVGLVLADIVLHAEQVGAAFSGLSTEIGEFFGLVEPLISNVLELISSLVPTVESVGPAFSPAAFVLEQISAGIAAINEQLQFASNLFAALNFANLEDPLAATDEERNQLLNKRQRILNDIRQIEQGIAVSSGESLSHTVAQGDTLYDLARQYGVTVEELQALNGLTGNNILVGQELVVSQGSIADASAELATLQGQLDSIDAEMAGLPSSIQAVFDAFAGTPLFEQIFGSDAGATDRALQFFEDVRLEIQNIQSFIGEIGGGIPDIFAGNVEDGASRIQVAFDGIIESVLSVVDLFLNLNPAPLDDVAQGVLRAEEEFGGVQITNPLRTFVENIRSEFSKLASGDFSSIETWLEENVIQAVADGIEKVQMWLSGPASAIRGFVQGLVDSFLGEFTSFRRALEDSGIIETIQNAFNGLFGGILGDPFADLELGGDVGEGLDEIVPVSIFDRLISFKDRFFEFVGGLRDDIQPTLDELKTIFGPALDTLGQGIIGFVQGVLTVDWPAVQGTFDDVLKPILDGLGNLATGSLVTLSSIIAGVGTALPSLGLAIGDFGTAIGALTVGDIDAFFASMSSGLNNLWNAVNLFTGGAIGNFNQVFSDLGEVDYTGAAQGEIRADMEFSEESVSPLEGLQSRFTEIKDGIVGFFTDIQTQLAPVFEFLDSTLGQGLRDLGDGLVGFVDQILAADWTGVETILSAFGTTIGLLTAIFTSAALIAISPIISGLGAMLPDLGAALGEIANFFTALAIGDVDGMKTALHNFLGDIGTAFADFTLGAANNVLGVLESLTGMDFAGAEEGLGNLANQIGQLYNAFLDAFDIKEIVLEAQELVLDFLLDAQLAYTAFLRLTGQGDAANAAQADTQETAQTLVDIRFATSVDEVLQQQLDEGQIDLSAPVTVDFNGTQITKTIGEILADPELVALIGDDAQELFTGAFNQAVASEDFATARNLLQDGIAAGLDVSSLDLPLGNLFAGLGEADAAALGIDLQAAGMNVGQIFSDAIGQAIANGDIDTAQMLTNVATEVGGEEGLTSIAQNLATNFGDEVALAFGDLSVEGLTNLGLSVEEAQAIATNIMSGLTLGLTEGQPALEEATQTMTDGVQGIITEGWRVNSPSEWMREIGIFMMEGLALGMTESVGLVQAPMQMVVDLEYEMGTAMVAVAQQWIQAKTVMIDAIGKVEIQISSLIPQVRLLQNEIAKLGAVPVLFVVPGTLGAPPVGAPSVGSTPALAEGGRGQAGILTRVAEPSIGGIELIRTDAGGTYMVSSTGFEAFPPKTMTDSNFVYGNSGGGNAGGGASVSNSWGDIHINVPAGTREVTPEVIKAGMVEWSKENPPARQHRNNV